ncbi:uncharacterized protein LOC141763827 isoform X2 [Sebastes fasciatus]|uniref:uncharacterized protein LOC141763827 isoform X2 n=1 Tax=Sebastes fasciatus TaxID=394691 RepID=UPI003D9FAA91
MEVKPVLTGNQESYQLKSVMEHVLDFAVHELTKIVEASFDDLLLEITKMEREQQVLEERLDQSSDKGGGGGGDKGRGGGGGDKGRGGGGGGGGGDKGSGGGGDKGRGGGGGGGGEKGRGGGGRRRGSENDSVSPSGSEDTREEVTEVTVSKEMPETDDPERPPVLAVSQDWVPILDKVFGQKWCSDVWQIKELAGGGAGGVAGGRSLVEGGAEQVAPLSAPAVTLEPSPSSPQQDPRWTPLEDMEVFSPDDDAADGQRNTTGPPPGPGPSPGPTLSPTGSSVRRSSASMLHRLLTLPSQLLEDEDENAAAIAKETLAALAIEGANDRRDDVEAPGRTRPSPTREEEEEEEEEEEGEGEEEEEEDKGRKKKRRRVWSECEECGRRFSRMSLLKAHRQTHVAENAAADTSSPSSPPAGSASALRCSDCGKRFSSATRLHSHVRTQHPGTRT